MRFTESHEWIRLQDKIGTVGITEHAQNELGEVVFIELPKVGQSARAGEQICVLESTKAAADIYSPVTGTVVAVNELLKKNPSLINRDAEKGGWLFQIELSAPKEVDRLLTRENYLILVKG